MRTAKSGKTKGKPRRVEPIQQQERHKESVFDSDQGRYVWQGDYETPHLKPSQAKRHKVEVEEIRVQAPPKRFSRGKPRKGKSMATIAFEGNGDEIKREAVISQ